jgi:NAD(P)-dependent dehydrogenase (short-subunit alcohol dehydrogenase family)
MGILEGKVVWVTGGGNGIGKDCALIAAKEGAAVVVNDLGGGIHGGDEGSAGPAETVAAEIRKGGGRAFSNSDSVSSLAAMQALRDRTLKEFGGLHAVMNPAGILRDAMFHKMTEKDWDTVIDVHLRGSFNVCRATVEHFREQNDGAYVLFTSTSGLYGNIGQTNYGAAKMGICGLARIIAMEGATKNIRANAIAPVAWTRLTQSVPVRDEAQAARRAQMAATIRADQPAKLSVALCADGAKDISGQFFGSRGDDIILYSQPRPIATLHKDEGWSPEAIVNEALPQLKEKAVPLSGSAARPAPQPAQAKA